jgi:predicted nucleotide-binding protein (sugar kinase/HSP70/actin superfamily)
MMRIGIPRALLYYQYYLMWKTFFEELGAEVVVSPATTQAMLECDQIFIPAIRSVQSNVYNCSKFLGLPDMTRAVIPEAPPILEIEIDINQGKRKLYQAIYKLGRDLTWNPFKVRQASLAAWQAYRNYREVMSSQGLTPPEAIERITGTSEAETRLPTEQLTSTRATIALIGHPYLIYDEYTNHRLIHRLEQANIKVLTPEMLTTEELEAAIARLVGKAYWTYEEEVVGAGGHYLQNGADGVIGIMAFGCGPDSLMMDMVRRRATRLRDTPFMNLTLEEHTAEAGLVTRLEAFLDMLYRRKRREVKVCV